MTKQMLLSTQVYPLLRWPLIVHSFCDADQHTQAHMLDKVAYIKPAMTSPMQH